MGIKQVKDNNKMNLYTIEAWLNYHDLPVNLKEGWSSGFLDYVGENPRVKQFVSLNGRLCRKCIFIGNEQLAKLFVNYLQAKADTSKRAIELKMRLVDDNDLAYRKKTAQSEADANDAKLRELLG